MTLKEKKLLALVYMDVYKSAKGRRIKVIVRDGWFVVSYPELNDACSGEYLVCVSELMIKLSLLSAQLPQGVDTATV
jgi:hypothetical protein